MGTAGNTHDGEIEEHSQPNAKVIRVAIVAEESEALTSTVNVIDAEPDLAVVGIGASGADARKLATDLRPQVLMLDFSLPDDSGEFVTRAVIQSGDHHPAVLAVTSSLNEEFAFAAICAGASGVCTDVDSPNILTQSVRSVAAGDVALSPPLLGRLLPRLIPRHPVEIEVCSSREVEVLGLVAEGATNPEIADRLYISQTTVRSHVQSLRLKLGVRNRVGLVVLAHRSGLAQPTLTRDLNRNGVQQTQFMR